MDVADIPQRGSWKQDLAWDEESGSLVPFRAAHVARPGPRAGTGLTAGSGSLRITRPG